MKASSKLGEKVSVQGSLEHLDEEQRRAVTAGDDALLIVAGAGTGKTTTLVHRLAWLLEQGADPGRVMLITFTRRAAGDMTRRAEALLSASSQPQAASRIWSGTFHSVAARLLRLHAADIGLSREFTIVDRSDAEDLMHLCRTDLALEASSRRFPLKSTCLDIYSRCVNAQQPLDDVLRSRFPWCRHAESGLAELFTAYTDAKERQHVLDYDDLLLFWGGLLADEVAGGLVRERFDHVLVDEYQDTNALQADIVELLRPGGTGVTCVGDDAQAIYGFRAATVRNILDFEQRFPSATVLTLTRNYRSTGPILQATNAIAAQASERREKNLWTSRTDGETPWLITCRDETEQSSWVAERVLEHREQGIALKQQAVMFRAQHHSMALEMELSRRQIPFRKYGGLRFIEAAHVKDLVALLRLSENARDGIACMRVLGLVPGIGPKTASALHTRLIEGGGDFEAWVGAPVPEAARATWSALVGTLRSVTAMSEDVPAQIHAIRGVYDELLERVHDNVPARLADLDQIENLASNVPDRTSLLSELVLDPPSWSGDLAGPPLLDEDWLVLSTMHSAKGLEFDVAYVIHAADGNIPSDMATGSAEEVDEERRLFYVACTRAKHHLYVTHPLRYYRAGHPTSDRYGYAQRTRFIDADVDRHFAQSTAAPEDTIAAETALPQTTPADIRGSVRALW